MKSIALVILYTALTIAFLQNWLWLAVLLLLVCSFRYSAVMVIGLAVVVDGYFGNFFTVPYLSLLSVWWYLVVEYLRPKVVNTRIFKYE